MTKLAQNRTQLKKKLELRCFPEFSVEKITKTCILEPAERKVARKGFLAYKNVSSINCTELSYKLELKVVV